MHFDSDIYQNLMKAIPSRGMEGASANSLNGSANVTDSLTERGRGAYKKSEKARVSIKILFLNLIDCSYTVIRQSNLSKYL